MEDSWFQILSKTKGRLASGVSDASLGTIWTLRTVRLIVIGRAAGALATVTPSTSWSAEPGATRSPVTAGATVAAAPPLSAGRVTDEVLGEVQQFRAVQLAIAILVETHGVFDEALRRRRTPRSATRSAGSPALSELTLSGRTTIAAGTSAVAAEASPSGTGSAVILSARTCRVPSRSGVFTASATAAGGPQFVVGKLAIAVLVELFERGGSVGDLLGGEDPVVVRIERLHQRVGRAVRASAARRIFLALVVVAAGRACFAIFPLRRTFGRLRDDNHRARQAAELLASPAYASIEARSMIFGAVADEFHDDHSLANASATEQPDLAAL